MDYAKIKLWFFRDLTNDQRLALFRLHELPPPSTMAQQEMMLGYVMTVLPVVKYPSDEERRRRAAGPSNPKLGPL